MQDLLARIERLRRVDVVLDMAETLRNELEIQPEIDVNNPETLTDRERSHVAAWLKQDKAIRLLLEAAQEMM